jgi:FixJ family two-component response regulator
VLTYIIAGWLNKQIAFELGTVEDRKDAPRPDDGKARRSDGCGAHAVCSTGGN